MYLIAIYDNDSSNVNNISEAIKSILIEHKVRKISIMQILDSDHLNLCPCKVSDCHLLLISLAMPNALEFACKISKISPLCKIIIYGENNFETKEIISCRPSALLKNSSDTDSLKEWLEQEFENSSHAKGFIFLETKKAQIILSVNEIIYFSSEGHYINVINAKSNLNERFKYKLDALQSMLSESIFVRIHKSYLASLIHITKLDKKQHLFLMDNGDKLPISDYYYKDVIKKLRQFCPFEL